MMTVRYRRAISLLQAHAIVQRLRRVCGPGDGGAMALARPLQRDVPTVTASR